jgi:hypothetical protein
VDSTTSVDDNLGQPTIRRLHPSHAGPPCVRLSRYSGSGWIGEDSNFLVSSGHHLGCSVLIILQVEDPHEAGVRTESGTLLKPRRHTVQRGGADL